MDGQPRERGQPLPDIVLLLPDGLDSVGHQSHLTSLDGMGRNGINRESWTDGLQTLPGRTFFTLAFRPLSQLGLLLNTPSLYLHELDLEPDTCWNHVVSESHIPYLISAGLDGNWNWDGLISPSLTPRTGTHSVCHMPESLGAYPL